MAYSKTKEVLVAWDRRCGWCGEHILKGRAAMCIEGADGGDHYREWMHHECHSAWTEADPDDVAMCSPGTFKRGTTEQK